MMTLRFQDSPWGLFGLLFQPIGPMRRGGLTSLLIMSIYVIDQNFLLAEQFPEPAPKVKTYEWSISPAKEPGPSLKYKLLMDPAEYEPGNAAVFYKRARRLVDQIPRKDQSSFELLDLFEIPLDKLPREEIRRILSERSGILAELQLAAQCETCDWGIRFKDLRGMAVIETSFDELQHARSHARILRLKSRLEIAEMRFDDAIDSIRQLFQMSRNVATEPCLIGKLIATAIQAVAIESLSELIAAEGSPNMYWAIRSLPDPVVDFEPAIRLESTNAFRIFPFLKEADKIESDSGVWQKRFANVFVSLNDENNKPSADHLITRMQVVAMMVRTYPVAKRELIAGGYDRTRVEEMSVGQVIAIYARDCHQHTIDETIKWMTIPFSEGDTFIKVSQQKLIDDEYQQGEPDLTPLRDPLLIHSRLMYFSGQIREASNRQRRMIPALAVIEAVRIHAAANGGKLPASLDQITAVPIPVNSATGKSFLYRVVNQQAELLLPPTGTGDEYSGRRFLLRMK